MKKIASRSRRFFVVPAALAACTLVPAQLHAETVWAKGVSESSGWVDVNKNWDGDSQLCWAASASSVIAWWQAQADMSKSKTGTPATASEIYSAFTNSFVNKGAGAEVAWKWYFGGCDLVSYNYENDFQISDPKTSGRYWEDYVKTIADWPSVASDTPSWIKQGWLSDKGADSLHADSAAEVLSGLLKQGAGISLLISYPNYEGAGHAVTLWGMEYVRTEKGYEISKIYITDSDDYTLGLITKKVDYKTETITVAADKDVPAYTWEKTTLLVDGVEGVVLSAYDALLLAPPSSPSVPEPSAFGLLAGTLALALVATRRRRKIRA